MKNKISLIIFICCAIVIHAGIVIHKDICADKYAYKEINSNYPYATNYELFIKEYPNSKYVKDAYGELYQIALEEGTFEALINYQTKYPKSPCIKDAKVEVEKKSNALYEEAKKINSINAWKNFLVKTPETHHKDANQILEILENKLWGTDDRAWTQANEENTIS
ncbi:MAG: hypothetical protein R3Y59_03380 [bacterium]